MSKNETAAKYSLSLSLSIYIYIYVCIYIYIYDKINLTIIFYRKKKVHTVLKLRQN